MIKNVFIVVASVFVTTSLAFSGFRVYRNIVAETMLHSKYQITTVIQTGAEKEALPTLYLTELLELSSDQPQNYFTFDERGAIDKLLKSPVIKSAVVKKIKPNIVYVDYEVFKPVALLGDSSNLALDEEGHVFPIHPFFSPKRLPEIYFGSEEVDKEKLNIALAILSYLDRREHFQESVLRLIDVSEALHESFGKREVVITLEEKGQIWYLRLTPHKFPEELNNYTALKETYANGSQRKKVVDLRLAKVAYVEEIPE